MMVERVIFQRPMCRHAKQLSRMSKGRRGYYPGGLCSAHRRKGIWEYIKPMLTRVELGDVHDLAQGLSYQAAWAHASPHLLMQAFGACSWEGAANTASRLKMTMPSHVAPSRHI